MKTYFVLTNKTEQEYLNNFSEFFKEDCARCDEYESTQKSHFESNDEQDKEIFQILHVFDNDRPLESFLYQCFKSLPEYQATVKSQGNRLIKKDIIGYRMYLPMDDAQVFSQVSESVHKIEDKDQWEDCNQTIMTLPNYSVCEMTGSQNPLVLVAIVR